MRQTPDFSGTWTLHLERSRLEIEKPTTTVFVIEHRDPALRVTRTHVYGDVSDTLTFELTTDGRSSTFRHRGIEADMRARWKGDELVITMELHLPDDRGTQVVRYQMEDGGVTFVADERVKTVKHRHHNVWVFTRPTSG